MKTRVVVDTDVFSYIHKSDSRGDWYESYLRGKEIVLSFVTVAELRYWSNCRNWGDARKRDLEEQIEETFVYHSDDRLCRVWANIRHELSKQGLIIHDADASIAATASQCGAPLITHNRKDFENILGLEVISSP